MHYRMSAPPPGINKIGRAGTQRTAASSASKRVFIIDDNVDGADSLATLLGLEGHTVSAANSPAEALQRIESFQPDVVLLDIGLPDMDGYELLRRLHMLPALDGVRFIATTGYGRRTDRERARQAGFDEHLVKPLSFEALAKLLAVGNGRTTVTSVNRQH